MHKAFPLPGIKFLLVEEVPTASEEGCHCQKKREATARKIALLSKSRRNYELASPIGDDSQGEACPTDSGLEAEHDREKITKTSTLPSDSTTRVTSLAADEGSMQQQLNELTDLVKLLEDRDGGGIAPSGEDAPINGRSLDEREEACIERSTEKGSNDTKEMEIRENFDPVWKQIEDFIPIGSKEEGERLKRKGIRFKQDSAKKVKTSEDVSEEDLKAMMQLVLVEELWALVKETLNIRQAANEKEKELWVELKRLYDSCDVHHVLSKDQEIFMLVEKDYPLRKGLAIMMIRNKLHVENYSQMANDSILKIQQIANSTRQRGETFFTSSGNFFWQWELITGSENVLSILFPPILL
nr:hypothetical protein [Tanacetum cinerariifolium]